jgi:hypothetical protein
MQKTLKFEKVDQDIIQISLKFVHELHIKEYYAKLHQHNVQI